MVHDPQAPESIEAVIFDCDGTLVDSEVISLKVLVDLLATHGLDVPHQEAVDKWSGCDFADVFTEIETRLGKKLPANFLETFREHQLPELAANVTPIRGAVELLQSMTLPFCIASNAPQNKVRLCLKTAGLLSFVDPANIFSAYDIQTWKPRPDLFLHAAKHMGVVPERCAVVEDSGVGVEAGLAAGMMVYGFDPHDKLPKRENVSIIRDLGELRQAFASL